VGQKIEAFFGYPAGKKYYAGVVTSVSGGEGSNCFVGMKYDDGDTEDKVPFEALSIPASPGEFLPGQEVEARFLGNYGTMKDRHYPGTVQKDNGDGTYEVLYEDGDVGKAVRFVRLKSGKLKEGGDAAGKSLTATTAASTTATTRTTSAAAAAAAGSRKSGPFLFALDPSTKTFGALGVEGVHQIFRRFDNDGDGIWSIMDWDAHQVVMMEGVLLPAVYHYSFYNYFIKTYFCKPPPPLSKKKLRPSQTQPLLFFFLFRWRLAKIPSVRQVKTCRSYVPCSALLFRSTRILGLC
jgi:hypothetical protein